MPPREKESRDDATAQPESGYPEGQVPTKPSADPESDKRSDEMQKGSEAEFDSPNRAVNDTQGR
jgi:hypothetical protein